MSVNLKVCTNYFSVWSWKEIVKYDIYKLMYVYFFNHKYYNWFLVGDITSIEYKKKG